MRKTFKIALITVAGLLALLIAAAAILAATFDPNAYKPQLIRLVQEKKQRTLSIPGEIRLSFFPKIGAELGKLSISEHRGSAEFASVDSARVSLALIPLLSKQLVVDQVQIEGLRANIRRFKDGSTNFDDLLATDQPAASQAGQTAGGEQAFRFDIEGVRLKKAQLTIDDQHQGRKLAIADLDLDSGKIAPGTPGDLTLAAHLKGSQPDIDAHIALKTGFTFDLDKKHYVLDGLDAVLKGSLSGMSDLDLKLTGDADLQSETKRMVLDGIWLNAKGKRGASTVEAKFDIPKLSVTDNNVSGGKLNGEARLTEGARSVTASFSVPGFEGSPQSFRLPALTLDAAVREGSLDAKLKLLGPVSGNIDKLLFTSQQITLTLDGKQGSTPINGSLTTPLTLDMGARLIELHKLNAGFTLPNPAGGPVTLKAAGNVAMNYGKQTGTAMLNGSIDQSAFRAKLGFSDFSPLATSFDIGIDQLDLDRYRSKPAATPPGKQESKPPAKEEAMDFAVLQKLHANGVVRVGTLKAANIRTANVRMDMRAANGRLDINPLSANLYGGSVSGAIGIVSGKPARFSVRQSLAGIDIGPLMKDAIDKDTLEGKGNVQIDLATMGGAFAQMKQGLNGNARLELRDGAIRGVNIAQAIREAKARIGQLRGDEKPQGGTGSATQKTDFSELTGSFRIVNGVAHNEDLVIKSPLVRVAGSGDINLAEDRLDYLARTTVVSTLQGQGGPELQSLKGLTVPVRLSGPFNAIGWRVDLAGMASELAKQKLDERKEEVRAKAEKSLDEKKEKIRGQLQEQLKGLFGK